MLKIFEEFITYFKDNKVKTINKKFNSTLKQFSFYLITSEKDFQQDNIIFKQNNLQIIIIDHFFYDEDYFNICFDHKLVMIPLSKISILQPFFAENSNSTFYFIKNSKEIFVSCLKQIQFRISNEDQYIFDDEISIFSQNFLIYKENQTIINFWYLVNRCLSGFLIKKSYLKSNINRINNFFNQSEEKTTKIQLDKKDLISLKCIGYTSFTSVCLYYHIESEKLYAIKSSNSIIDQYELNQREIINYREISGSFPFIPKYFGSFESKNGKSLIIEFIDGETLYSCLDKLDDDEKLKILFEIMITIEYIHNKHFIYRDLKPNNVIIDKNKIAVLIDFDRMINYDEKKDQDQSSFTTDFSSIFIAPEILNGEIYYESDIYSIGLMISYMFNLKNTEVQSKYKQLNDLHIKCTSKVPSQRPSISKLIDDFYNDFFMQFHVRQIYKGNQENLIKQLSETNTIESVSDIHTEKYRKYWICLAESDNPHAQYQLGLIYFDGKDGIKIDCIKSFHYFSMASEHNIPGALHSLGLMYGHEGNYIAKDAKKAFECYQKAANLGFPQSIYNLGFFYLNGIYIKKDVDEAIRYFSIAFDKGIIKSLYALGIIYFQEPNYVNMNKAIDYFLIASYHNQPEAQNILGDFYLKGIFLNQDINLALEYYHKAAANNNADAQCSLGIIYLDGDHVKQDINKAFNYLSLAEKQNVPRSFYALGKFYQYYAFKMDKAINYFKKASDMDIFEASVVLGNFYRNGVYVNKDINKAIFYFEKAAKKDDTEALNLLGIIYSDGSCGKHDFDKAVEYWSRGLELNDVDCIFNLGLLYSNELYKGKDDQKTISLLSIAAEKNLLEAQFLLGQYYYLGKFEKNYLYQFNIGNIHLSNKNSKMDLDKSVYYFTKAANQNCTHAQILLGNIYLSYKYYKRDIDKSIYYFTQAAKKGSSAAQLSLGFIYKSDLYNRVDIKKSLYYLELAASQNVPKAYYFFGLIYLEGKHVPKDINKSNNYFSKAAEMDVPEAQFYMSNLYIEGIYVEKDINKGFDYLRKAAEQGMSEAQYNLAFYSQNGIYTIKDVKKAIYYYSLAAESNNPDALFQLGMLYYFGKDVPKNVQKGISYLSSAAKLGDPAALYNLGIFYYKGDFVEQNINKAIKYITLAANKKQTQSLNFLGIFYYEGIYTRRNIAKAIDYFNQASTLNNSDSQYNLGCIYLNGKFVNRNMSKAIVYFELSLKNGNKNAGFYLGSIYQEGTEIKQDIDKAIYYYKIASCISNNYAKNNLAIIYKEININYSIELLQEAISIKNDAASIYNLAKIYFYDDKIQYGKYKDNWIDLLILLSSSNFIYAKFLLCLVLIKKVPQISLENIEKELQKHKYFTHDLASELFTLINSHNLEDPFKYNFYYEHFKINDYRYLNEDLVVPSSYINKKIDNIKNIPCINEDFYDGIGEDVLINK